MIYYVIRHKKSGELMPQAKRNKGYSHWNPSNKNKKFDAALSIPRLIETKKQANNIIAQWNANPNSRVCFTRGDFGDEVDLNIKPDGRRKEDLEVVKIELKERK